MPQSQKPGTRCASGGCVDVKPVVGGFRFTSTIDGNDDAVVYTEAEVTQFFADVKAGNWDHLLA